MEETVETLRKQSMREQISRHLQENLEDVTKTQYDQLIIQAEDSAKNGDIWLKDLLNSLVRNTHARFAFSDTDSARNYKVGTVIKIVSEGYEEYKGFFSKKDGKFTAFITYREDEAHKIIEEIKMFSLTKEETELAKDLIDLIEHFLVNHTRVNWSARSDNPKAIRHYDAYVRHEFNQVEQKIPDNNGLVHYSVP